MVIRLRVETEIGSWCGEGVDSRRGWRRKVTSVVGARGLCTDGEQNHDKQILVRMCYDVNMTGADSPAFAAPRSSSSASPRLASSRAPPPPVLIRPAPERPQPQRGARRRVPRRRESIDICSAYGVHPWLPTLPSLMAHESSHVTRLNTWDRLFVAHGLIHRASLYARCTPWTASLHGTSHRFHMCDITRFKDTTHADANG